MEEQNRHYLLMESLKRTPISMKQYNMLLQAVGKSEQFYDFQKMPINLDNVYNINKNNIYKNKNDMQTTKDIELLRRFAALMQAEDLCDKIIDEQLIRKQRLQELKKEIIEAIRQNSGESKPKENTIGTK